MTKAPPIDIALERNRAFAEAGAKFAGHFCSRLTP